MKESEERDRFLVEEMLTHLKLIARIADRGKGPFVSTEGEESRYAMREAIELLAEAVEKVSGSFEKANPGIPWKDFRPLRKRVAHPYDLGSEPANVRELWVFASEQAPRILSKLRSARFHSTDAPGR
ncbi:MAG: HepT-like ribonuclease domain-containing protein [Thermoplasmata archaeon]